MGQIMKRVLLVFGLFFLVTGFYQPVLAEEQGDDLDMLLESLDIEEDYAYEFPVVDPEITLKLGYRIVDLDDSAEVFDPTRLPVGVDRPTESRGCMYYRRAMVSAGAATIECRSVFRG